MKHIKSFKIFEAESDEDKMNLSDEDSSLQRKIALSKAKKAMSVSTAGGKVHKIDLRSYNPVKYTDVPLDVYLNRKEKGVENVPEKEKSEKPKKEQEVFTINDLRQAISASEGMSDFKQNYPQLWRWYLSNKSNISEIEFDKLNRKDLESRINLKKIAAEKKLKEKELIKTIKEKERLENSNKRIKDRLERQEINRLNKINIEYKRICGLLKHFNYYENFKLIYTKEVKWLQENNLLERFLFYFDYKEGVKGLEVVEFSDDLRLKLNRMRFITQLDLSMTKKSFYKGKKIDIFNLKFKDIDKEIFLAKIDGDELPLSFTRTEEDTSYKDLISTLGYIKYKLGKDDRL
jgi:hypothetical protein